MLTSYMIQIIGEKFFFQILYQRLLVLRDLITFDGEGEWNLGSDSTRNVIIFGLDNSSSCHTEYRNDNFQCQVKEIALVLT